MTSIAKTSDGSYKFNLYLTEPERKKLKKLAKALGMNDFETIKHALDLVYWWSKNQIEPEENE